MESDLQVVRNVYDSMWLEVPFTNIPIIDEWLMVIHNGTCISDFIDHGIFPVDTPYIVKHQFHLSDEGATCEPFAIMVGEKLNREEWEVRYYHTGRHGAAVVRKLGSSQARYLVDSSLRSVYEIPAAGSSLWGTDHRFYTHQSLPPLPHKASPIIYTRNNDILYIPKQYTEPTLLVPRTRRQLVNCSIDAIPRDRNVILLLRDRIAATNRFIVLVSFDMQSRTMAFRGRNINETVVLASANGQPKWDAFSQAQKFLYYYHRRYPRQLSAGLL
jgi:hypothetical protein